MPHWPIRKRYINAIVVYSDVDECTASLPVCDVNAQCTNTNGSYACKCKNGFSGDGKTCQGLFSENRLK